MPARPAKPGSGSQTLERALQILRVIASSGPLGQRLVDIQRSTGLTKPTAHRITRALERNDFVHYDPLRRKYLLGPEISILSVSAPTDLPELQKLCREELKSLARETGDTAYLMVASGREVVCVAREIGSYPIKALTGEIGTRRPLGVGAAGIVLLASHSDEEVDEILTHNLERLRVFPNATPRLIRNAIRKSRERGYGYSNGLVISAVRGVGVAVHDRRGKTVAALSVGAVQERMSEQHVDHVIESLDRARRAIERKLRTAPKVTLQIVTSAD